MENSKPRTSGNKFKIPKEDFMKRFHKLFCDPHFDPFRKNLEEISEVAWENYLEGRKAPSTSSAGDGYADPEYELSADWLWAKSEIDKAREEHKKEKTNILLISASDRNEFTCPGEISKTSRLADIAKNTLEAEGIEVEHLDLSLMTAEYGKTIYPCKGCVSTAMPLCHFPCSCYPNHSLGQTHDWMNEIYPKWIRAHGVMIITPVYWHQAPSALKLMMDRLVCADGGNEDPTTTQGKKAELAKEIELKGWHYPRHLKGRVYSVVVHGDAVGANELKLALTEWLSEMEMISAGTNANISRYVGYMESYAESHEALDKDHDFQLEVRNAALTLALATVAERQGKLQVFEREFHEPRPK
ncbi:MAG: NAD(P)H-dependent oxidoreductase [Bdellovibrionota bacterium]